MSTYLFDLFIFALIGAAAYGLGALTTFIFLTIKETIS